MTSNLDPSQQSNAAQNGAPAAAPAGWYPVGAGSQRWWDGAQWTEHVQPAAQAAGAVPGQQPKKSRNGLLIGLIAAASVLAIGVMAGTAALATSILRNVTNVQELRVDPPTETPAPQPDSDEEPGGFGDAFAERDQFFVDQQLPLDGSMPSATTPAQQEYIAALKQDYADYDIEWTENSEAIAISLTADACETSILNQHRVDANLARTHASTSPLITQLIDGLSGQDRSDAIDSWMYDAVLGVQYLCPNDHSQWQTAFDTVNGDW